MAVSLGVECPLFVPVPEDPYELGKGRRGEGNRSFSAGAGSGVLVTGLVQLCWILRKVKRSVVEVRPTFSFDDFDSGIANFVIWEAFVSGSAKGDDHAADAQIALENYQQRRRNSEPVEDVTANLCFSLAGAALMWSSLNHDVEILRQSCSVLKV